MGEPGGVQSTGLHRVGHDQGTGTKGSPQSISSQRAKPLQQSGKETTQLSVPGDQKLTTLRDDQVQLPGCWQVWSCGHSDWSPCPHPGHMWSFPREQPGRPCPYPSQLKCLKRALGRPTWRLEKAMAPHPSTLAWKTPWTEEPSGLQSMGSRRVGHD